jgi:hypothetical protein
VVESGPAVTARSRCRSLRPGERVLRAQCAPGVTARCESSSQAADECRETKTSFSVSPLERTPSVSC